MQIGASPDCIAYLHDFWTWNRRTWELVYIKLYRVVFGAYLISQNLRVKKDKYIYIKEIAKVPSLSDHILFGSAIGRSSSIHKARGLSNRIWSRTIWDRWYFRKAHV